MMEEGGLPLLIGERCHVGVGGISCNLFFSVRGLAGCEWCNSIFGSGWRGQRSRVGGRGAAGLAERTLHTFRIGSGDFQGQL